MTPLISIVTMAGGVLEHVFFLSTMVLSQQGHKNAKELGLWKLWVSSELGGSRWDGREPLAMCCSHHHTQLLQAPPATSESVTTSGFLHSAQLREQSFPKFVKSYVAWVGRDLKCHLVPTPLLQAGIISTRPGCTKLHPTWPHPGMEHPQLLGATRASCCNCCHVHQAPTSIGSKAQQYPTTSKLPLPAVVPITFFAA